MCRAEMHLRHDRRDPHDPAARELPAADAHTRCARMLGPAQFWPRRRRDRLCLARTLVWRDRVGDDPLLRPVSQGSPPSSRARARREEVRTAPHRASGAAGARLQAVPGSLAGHVDRIEPISPAYRGGNVASTPSVVWWAASRVTGLELPPGGGAAAAVGDHDSYGTPGYRDRGDAPAGRSGPWRSPRCGRTIAGAVLRDGQVPIQRGPEHGGALDRAIEELRKGTCIGIYPRAHTFTRPSAEAQYGVGHTWRRGGGGGDDRRGCVHRHGRVTAVPRARLADVAGRVLRVHRPAIAPEESPQQYSTRLLAQLRQRAPIGRGPQARRRRSWSAFPLVSSESWRRSPCKPGLAAGRTLAGSARPTAPARRRLASQSATEHQREIALRRSPRFSRSRMARCGADDRFRHRRVCRVRR